MITSLCESACIHVYALGVQIVKVMQVHMEKFHIEQVESFLGLYVVRVVVCLLFRAELN